MQQILQQCLPSLLERDRASSPAAASHNADADRSQQQPPIPGGEEWKPSASLLEQLWYHHQSLRPLLQQQEQQAVNNHQPAGADCQRSDEEGTTLQRRSGADPTRPDARDRSAGRNAGIGGVRSFRGDGRKEPDHRGDYRNSGGGGGVREKGLGGDATDPEKGEFAANVIERLSRMIAGCARLLRLRGNVGEGDLHALRVMSERKSPALLVAVKAYGAIQNLEVGTERVFVVV